MLSKCANPACSNLFLYLHQGRLFRMDTGAEAAIASQFQAHAHRVEFFWLCDDCAANMTVIFEKERGVAVRLFRPTPPAASPPVKDASTSRLSHSSESAASRPASEYHPAAG